MPLGPSSAAVPAGRTRRRSRRHGAIGLRLAPIVLALAALAAIPTSAIGASAASATPAPGPHTCAGTQGSPGVVAGGDYTALTINGVCEANDGQVVVSGTVTVTAGSALIAAFAKNDVSHTGTSGLSAGDIVVDPGATLVLGCEASVFPCVDDSQVSPTLNSPMSVSGNITATNALGVIVHVTTIGGDVLQTGGGGGANCNPQGVFNLFMSPVYSDYEDNTIGGNLVTNDITSCWFGALREKVGGSIVEMRNTFADPDAMEILTNTVAGNMICAGNSPANQYGDSSGMPDMVGGFAVGQCGFGVTAANPPPSGPRRAISLPDPKLRGYWLAGGDGGVFALGAPFYGSTAESPPAQPAVGIAATPGGGGYCVVAGNGQVFSAGPHPEACAASPTNLNAPIVGMAASPQGDGGYLAAGDGGVFASGRSPFYGSAGALKLSKPVVGVATTPFGDGYYLVAADGGVFSYGPGATFHGSAGALTLNKAIVGMAVDPMTGGYWLVAADGGVFAYDAPYLGSMGGRTLNQPIVGIAAAPTGDGYYLVAADGGIFAFGKGAHFQGSTGAIKLSSPVVGMALG